MTLLGSLIGPGAATVPFLASRASLSLDAHLHCDWTRRSAWGEITRHTATCLLYPSTASIPSQYTYLGRYDQYYSPLLCSALNYQFPPGSTDM